MKLITHTKNPIASDIDDGLATDLMRAARQVSAQAHCPYSDFHVGAAIIMADDPQSDIYTGCNVENASFGATICAERNAITSAIVDGYRRIGMLAIACPDSVDSGGDEKIHLRSPCGICRQVIGEFADDDLIVLLSRPDGDADVLRFGDLFPYGFRLR